MLLMESGRKLGIVEARNTDPRRFELLQLVTQGPWTDAKALGGQLAAAAGDPQEGYASSAQTFTDRELCSTELRQ